MNYRVFADTKNIPFLAEFDALPHLRPKVKDTIRIGNKPRLYKITREKENTKDLTPGADVSFDYFVRVLGSSPDTRTMGQDIAKLTKTLRRLGR